MSGSVKKAHERISSIELLSMVGYSFLNGWMLLTFFWLGFSYSPDSLISVINEVQMCVFLGVPVTYFALRLLGKRPSFHLFSIPFLVGEFICAILFSVCIGLGEFGVALPFPVVCVAGFLAGGAYAALNVSWLDVCSRLKTRSFGRFTGLSYVGGVALFSMASVSPENLQFVFSMLYILVAVGIFRFCSTGAENNDIRADRSNVENHWLFLKEVEPSLFMFGVVFALTFTFLFNTGKSDLMLCVLFSALGAGVIAILSIIHKEIGITPIQRAMVFVTVAGCIAMPFVDRVWQIAISAVILCAWSAITVVTHAFIVKKSVIRRDTPLFRQAPARLCVATSGFALGWAIAMVITIIFGAHSEVFGTLRLVTAIVLIAIVMVFFPVAQHHNPDGTSTEQTVPEQTTVISVDRSESELLEMRCAAVSKLYQLSPRESEILGYLARGRNAAYIQEELTISPHTAKSHIYNIYRKTDIHSQQKLMSFVSEFPLEGIDVE